MKTKEEKLIERMVRKCMNHLKKKDYELGITKRDVEAAVKCTKVVSKDWCSGATYGGRGLFKSTLTTGSTGVFGTGIRSTMLTTNVP